MPSQFSRTRLILMFVILFAAACFGLRVARNASASAAANANTSVIVELRDEPAAVYKARTEKAGGAVTKEALQTYRNQLRAGQDQMLADLRSRGVNFTVATADINDFAGNLAGKVEYRYTLIYNGVTLNVPKSAISTIESLPQVKKVHATSYLHIALQKSVDYINAPKAYGTVQEVRSSDSGVYRDGYEGQGINIAVLDTGIEWAHEMFGGDPTPPRLGIAQQVSAVGTNKKVIYYLPIAGTKDDFGHGTHASADAAGYLGMAPGPDGLPGTADDIAIHGVAPQARLMGYKVCTGTGSCLNAATMLAIEDAVSPYILQVQGAPANQTLIEKPIANVINLSLGGAGNADDPEAISCDNASKLGTVVVAAAGNDGPGDATVGSPAASRRAIAVGATTDPGTGVNTADVIGGRAGMQAIVMDGSPAITTDVINSFVYCGMAETADTVPDTVRGHIALIQRGSTVNTPELPAAGSLGTGLFVTKAANAFAKGAVAVIFYNNVPGELGAASVKRSVIPVVGMSDVNGEYLTSLVNSTVGTVSTQQIRINRGLVFTPAMADFSSRGPISGLGQIKPDVSAPGVNIISATVRVGAAETNTGTMFDPTGYIAASGTSFACPHVAGSAALIKQAHPDWTPDMVRAALINTATNLRSSSGVPKADDGTADQIMAQGGGLVDVYHAINAKAMMGHYNTDPNDASNNYMLGSYSFGEFPVINTRTTHTESVSVTIQDVSGQEGTYNLSIANNHLLEQSGITSTLSTQTVTVPANGAAIFTVNATIDGDKVRDTSEPLQMQWYVVAQRAGGQDSIRMPLYMRLIPTVPAGVAGTETQNLSGSLIGGDAGQQLVSGVTYQDFPLNLDASTMRLDTVLDWDEVSGAGLVDLDLYLYGPDGVEIASSAEAGGPEHLNALITHAGTYTLRVVGFTNGPTDFTLTNTISKGGLPPTLNVTGDFTDAQGKQVDFDGNYPLTWQLNGNVQQVEIERSTDGNNFTVIADVPPTPASYQIQGQDNGEYFYRLRALTPGQIGSYVTVPGAAKSIVVDKRTLVEITGRIKTAVSNVSLTNGVWQMDMTMTNNSGASYIPYVDMNIIGIKSASNTVSVLNADNNGNGTSANSAALFGYSNQLGADQIFSPTETTGTRTMRFADAAGEMFTVDVVVTAYTHDTNGVGSSSNTGGAPDESKASALSRLNSLQSMTGVMRITVNPLTKLVTTQLVHL